MNRRVVITGLGLVTPLACGVEPSWKALIAGKSGARKISRFDPEPYPCQIACEVPYDGPDAFNPDEWASPKDQRRFEKFSLYAVAATAQALKNARWDTSKNREAQIRTGVSIGSGIGGLGAIEDNMTAMLNGKRISAFFLPKALINMAAGNVSIRFQLKGPNVSPVTACASGAHAIGDAARLVMLGNADVMIAGGSESSITPLGIGGFCSCRALSTNFNHRPQQASRPYDKDRDGFVMGEGAGVLILEAYEHAKARGAKILAEIVGYGLSGDAWHITAPARDGDGALRAMQAAINQAGLNLSDIAYINAHGTSTPLGDEIELSAVDRLFSGNSENLTVSSTKSSTGHLLGAAGAVEAVFSILAIRDGIAPPTLNLDAPDVKTDIDLAPKVARRKTINAVMSNSFGFGGTNASLIFKKMT